MSAVAALPAHRLFRRARVWGALVCAPVLLCGCLPAPYGPYYHPTYADPAAAVPVKAYCGGQAGPPTGLTGPLAPGLRWKVDAAGASQAAPVLRIQFQLAPGQVLQFQDDRVQVEAGGRASGERMPLRTVSQFRVAADQVAHALAPAPVARPGAAGGAPTARMSVGSGFAPGIAGLRPERLTLQWPDVVWADGAVTRFPAVALQGALDRGWFRYRSAQESARLRARHAQCLQETPNQNCRFILESHEHSFMVQSDGATLEGRLLVTDPARPRLDAYITLDLPRVLPWRWSAPQAVVTDAESGRSTRQPLAASAVTVTQDGLPLSTRLQAPEGGETSVGLELPLQPAAAPRYRVLLPPLELQGVPLRLQPIELERRLLDGGIEPFNC